MAALPDSCDRVLPFFRRSCPDRRTVSSLPSLLLVVVLIAHPTADSPAENKLAAHVNEEASIAQFIEARFPHWDSNHDGILDLREVNRQIENPSVQDREAAVMVVTFRRLLDSGKSEHPRVSRKELITASEGREFQRAVEANARKLGTIDRRLFLPTDPNLESFHQGRVGDCYLLAAIAAAVHSNPQSIRDMIHPAKSGGFDVSFGDGERIHVPAMTDGELLLGATMDSTHGIWLAVLEKAFGIVRERRKAERTGKPIDPKAVVPEIVIDGGLPGPIISLLTGHEVKAIRNRIARKGQPVIEVQQLHELLTGLTKHRRLMTTGAGGDGRRPPGIVGGHVYAVLDYDSAKRQLTIFNPWGQTFKPKGEPGLDNGYTTTHGAFDVPLGEFHEVFGGLAYETNKPLSEGGNNPAHGGNRRKK